MIAVVYLYWTPMGEQSLSRFMNSYHSHPAGIEHELIVAVKGKAELNGLPATLIQVPDEGMDIPTYLLLASTLEHETACFLNTSTEILDYRWLSKMTLQLQKRGVGLVGATGSYECSFESTFPNVHIRTNGFMLNRRLLLDLGFPIPYPGSRQDAYEFESGPNSLTRRIQRMGLSPIVVGSNGCGYEVRDWPFSRTFRLSHQENLLFDDNQTRFFSESSDEIRRFLTSMAWGKQKQAEDSARIEADRVHREVERIMGR